MQTIPFWMSLIQGAIGKRFVVKHYKSGKIVVTKYPDMSRVIPSQKQRAMRQLFREAVCYAKWVLAEERRKKAFQATLPWERRSRVFQAAIQLYMRVQGNRQWLRKQLAVQAMERVQQEDRPIVIGEQQGVIGNMLWTKENRQLAKNNRQGIIGNTSWVIASQQEIGNSREWAKNNRLWAIGMDQKGMKGGGAIRCSERVICSKQGLEKRIRGETEMDYKDASPIRVSVGLVVD